MSIPTPEERPDLYDDFDGFADGRKSSIEVQAPDWMEKLKQGGSAEKVVPAPEKPEA